jgi:MSHA biogenesis protein MshK
MKPSLVTRHSSLAAALALMLYSASVAAQANDPTRPPEGLSSGAAGADAGDAGGGMMLQSVMISTAGRAAIINGVMVKLGQKYGDAVLVKVAENEVVLKGGAGTQVLKLHPAVDKRVAATAAPARGAPRRAAPAGAAEEKGK